MNAYFPNPSTRLLLSLALAAALAAAQPGGAVAQAKPKSPSAQRAILTRPNELLRQHDLEVQLFGRLAGAEVGLGGAVKNRGLATYPGGRKLQVFVDSGKGGWIPQGEFDIPALQPGQGWPLPNLRFQASALPTRTFLANITTPAKDRDANYANDRATAYADDLR